MSSEVTCNFHNCSKSFHNVYSLARHVKNHHCVSYDLQDRVVKKIRRTEVVRETNSCEKGVDQCGSSAGDIEMLTFETIPDSLLKNFSIEAFKNLVFKFALCFITKLYAFGTINRKNIHEIVNSMCEMYLCNCMEFLQKKYTNMHDLNKMLNIVRNGFKTFKSEHMTFKYLKNIKCLIVPKMIVVNAYLSFGKRKRRGQFLVRENKLSVIPLNAVLQKFLELPNIFDSIMKNITDCKRKQPYSFFNSKFWKSIELKFTDEIILPLILYFDDLEINNPLGSRKVKNKIGATYCSILGIPCQYASMLENIILAQLHNYLDHKYLGNKRLFHNIIQQLLDLYRNGITINVNNKEYRVYFQLAYITGDNLGLNTILGFSKGFNAHYSCRMCFMSKDEIRKAKKLKINALRNMDNYEKDAREKIFGVNEFCIFNCIPNYHVITNMSVDTMHDLLEGICRYDLGKILHCFIKAGYFTINILNERIKCFDGVSPDKNIPTLKLEAIQKEEIIISSSEMYYLVSNLNLMIGDVIPAKNKIWTLYLKLRKIVCIAMADSYTMEMIDSFDNLVSSYLTLCLRSFKRTLRTKHHNLLHYKEIMTNLGPLKNMSCIRFEGKHKKIKESSNVTTSRKNPSYTLALKHQLQMCNRFVLNEGISARISHGPVISRVSLIHNFEDFKHMLPSDSLHFLNCVSWVRVNGTFYSIDYAINIAKDDSVCFGKIKHIITGSEQVIFVYQKIRILGFSDHFSAFNISETIEWAMVKQTDLDDYRCYSIHMLSNSKKYISTFNYSLP